MTHAIETALKEAEIALGAGNMSIGTSLLISEKGKHKVIDKEHNRNRETKTWVDHAETIWAGEDKKYRRFVGRAQELLEEYMKYRLENENPQSDFEQFKLDNLGKANSK